MRLEAKDRMNPNLICVATITDIRDGKLLIHFDGWSNRYDYWCEPDTPDIHPIRWCDNHGIGLQPPHRKKFKFADFLVVILFSLVGRPGRFVWEQYLQEVGAMRVPDEAFVPAQR